MALDTNLTPEIVNSFNVYIDGVKAIGTAPEITLPQITSETIDVSGAGILGKISAPNIGQFESIEQEVSFNLVYSSFVNVLSPKRQVNLTFRVAQQAVDKSLGYAYKGLRIVEVGRVKEFTPGKIKAGEGMEAKVKLELTYIMIENDGEEIIAIDKLNGVYRVQGEDMRPAFPALIYRKKKEAPAPKARGGQFLYLNRKENHHGKECFFRRRTGQDR